MHGHHVENYLEANDVQVSMSWAFLLADAPTRLSEPQSQAVTVKTKKKDPSAWGAPCTHLTMSLGGHHIHGTRLQH